jgi:hypothetical protein
MNFSVVVVERIHPLASYFFLFYASIVVKQEQRKKKKKYIKEEGGGGGGNGEVMEDRVREIEGNCTSREN